jgi:GntR family transcriptional regulator
LDVPRYIELSDRLKEQTKDLAPNVLLPSEDQLAKRFGVSRMTIRRALDLLEQGGLVDRQRGRGTVVSQPRVTRTLFPTIPIEKDFENQGLLLETEILSVGRSEVSEGVLNSLGVSDPSKVTLVSLLRRVDGRVICVDRRYVPIKIGKRLDMKRVAEVPIAVLIAEASEKLVVRHDWKLDFHHSDASTAKLLGVTPDALVVVSSGVDYLDDGTPLCVSQVQYRIDRVNFYCSAPYKIGPSKRK